MNKKVIIVNVLLTLIFLVICDFCVGLLYNKLAPAYGKKNIDILLGTIGTESMLRQPSCYHITCLEIDIWGQRSWCCTPEKTTSGLF